MASSSQAAVTASAVSPAVVTATAVDSLSPLQPQEQQDQDEQLQKKPGFIHRTLFSGGRFTSWRHLLLVLALGQLLSFCITSTNTINAKLSMDYNVAIPTTQSLLNYVLLALVYIPYTIYRKGWNYFWSDVIKKRAKWYVLLALVDVEANYFVVKSFQYTSMLSAMLLDSWAIPMVMILSFKFLGQRYRWMQVVGVIICLGGEGALIASDVITGKNWAASDPVKGDLFCILGATLYGVSNVMEEYFVRKFPLYEVVGMLGGFASIISAIQLSILERHELQNLSLPPLGVGLIIIYDISLFILYSIAPQIFRLASATFFNLSLLTSDFYGLVVGIAVFGYYMYWLYPVAFVLVVAGMIIYNWFIQEPSNASGSSERGVEECNGQDEQQQSVYEPIATDATTTSVSKDNEASLKA